MRFDPRREIDGVPHTSIRSAMLCTGIPGNHPASCNANANMYLRFVSQPLLLIKTVQQGHHLQGGADRFFAVILPEDRCAEDRHKPIAKHLIDHAMISK